MTPKQGEALEVSVVIGVDLGETYFLASLWSCSTSVKEYRNPPKPEPRDQALPSTAETGSCSHQLPTRELSRFAAHQQTWET